MTTGGGGSCELGKGKLSQAPRYQDVGLGKELAEMRVKRKRWLFKDSRYKPRSLSARREVTH